MLKRFLIVLSATIVSVALICGIVFASFSASFSKGNYYILDEALFTKAREEQNTVYYAYDNGEWVEVFNTSVIIGRSWTAIDEIGDNLKNAFISAEDRAFYKHHGVNVKRTLGAIANYFLHTKSTFGASTITQQVIKNISGNNEQSVKRKFNEIMRAVHLEKIYGKDEILEVYLNIVPMSGNMYGVSAAARAYFGKEANELNLWEAATVAGITNSPTRYNPYNHPDDCVAKRNRVLYAMLDNGVISQQEYENAISQKLVLTSRDYENEVYSWFIEAANNDIINDLMNSNGISRSAASLLLRGCKVLLTEDVRVQRIMEEFFESNENFSGLINDGLNYSMVVTDNVSGNIVGLIGGVGSKNGNNLLNLTNVKVPPASTLKPLAIYAPMIESGMINFATVIDDTPITVKAEDGKSIGYPVNSPNVYAGLTTVADALRLSKNTVAAKLLEAYGYERCASELRERYGFDIISGTENIRGRKVTDMGIAPLALGQLSKGVTLRELTDAYAAFARDGLYKKGSTYHGVFDSNGHLTVAPNQSERRIYNAETARIMNQLLMGVVDDGTAKSIKLKEIVDTAGKTGTSSMNYDKLFIGYTPYYTAGIWTGYPTRKGTVSGVSPSHVTIWDEVMQEIHKQCVFDNHKPLISFTTAGLKKLPYCKDSGCLPSELCEFDLRDGRIAYGFFTDDNLPSDKCELHKLLGEFANGRLISAPYIERELPDGILITDDEYNYKNISEANGFYNGE